MKHKKLANFGITVKKQKGNDKQWELWSISENERDPWRERFTRMVWCPRQSHIRETGSWDTHPCHQHHRFHPRKETLLGHLCCSQKLWFWRESETFVIFCELLRRGVGRIWGWRVEFWKWKKRDWVAVLKIGREGREIEFPFCWSSFRNCTVK